MSELLARCSAREIAEWQAYAMLEPFGPPAEAFAAGIVASTIGNVNRAKGAKPFAPEDFMPQIAKPPEPAVVAKKRQADALSRRLRAWFGGGKR